MIRSLINKVNDVTLMMAVRAKTALSNQKGSPIIEKMAILAVVIAIIAGVLVTIWGTTQEIGEEVEGGLQDVLRIIQES